jgi:hypothetical protein
MLGGRSQPPKSFFKGFKRTSRAASRTHSCERCNGGFETGGA